MFRRIFRRNKLKITNRYILYLFFWDKIVTKYAFLMIKYIVEFFLKKICNFFFFFKSA